MSSTITATDYAKYIEQSIDYATYKEQMAADFLQNEDEKIKEYIHLNQRRMHRVEKTYKMSAEMMELLQNLEHKIYWLVLTEHWCGDASQILPVFHKIAEMSAGKIELKLVYRDQNLDLMHAYLTNGGQSIPKLIQLNNVFEVTGSWGPRPSPAQDLVVRLRANPETAATYANDLHLWYAKDKQKAIEAELMDGFIQ